MSENGKNNPKNNNKSNLDSQNQPNDGSRVEKLAHEA